VSALVSGLYRIETGFASSFARDTFGPGVTVEVIEWQEWPGDGSTIERTTRITGDAGTIHAVQVFAIRSGIRWTIPERIDA
jgi:hypothetical protein